MTRPEAQTGVLGKQWNVQFNLSTRCPSQCMVRHRRLKGRDGARLLRSSESAKEHGVLKRESDFIKSTFYREYSNKSSMGAELKRGELDSRIVREKTNCQPGCTAKWEKRAKCSFSP